MTQFAWHVHHDVWLEPLTEPIRRRRDYIRRWKPEREVALRLRLLKPVKGKLPTAVVKVGAAYAYAEAAVVKARAAYAMDGGAYIKAGAARNEAAAAYARVLVDHRAEIEVLHKRECSRCPWDGETIFPKRNQR